LLVHEKGITGPKKNRSCGGFVDLGHDWWFVQIWYWFVSFAIICRTEKEEKRSAKRLKNTVIENNHFAGFSGEQGGEERIKGYFGQQKIKWSYGFNYVLHMNLKGR